MTIEIEGLSKIADFTQKHADARRSMVQSVAVVSAASWTNFTAVKLTFNSADYQSGFAVFNVGDNKFRIQAEVLYETKTVSITRVGTHADYDSRRI